MDREVRAVGLPRKLIAELESADGRATAAIEGSVGLLLDVSGSRPSGSLFALATVTTTATN